jgi:hypothetical protein
LLYEEVKETIHADMPECDDWTPVPVYMKLVMMVAKISGRVFVGPELCRNKDYVDCAAYYTIDVINVQQDVKKINPWLRPILAPRLDSMKRLHEREKMAHDVLFPIIRGREEAEAKDPNGEKPDDMLAWFMTRRKDYGEFSTMELVKFQLGLIFGAVHTTSLSVTNMCVSFPMDLVAHPLTFAQIVRPRSKT